MPFQLLALNHVGVRCTKVAETERFYKETLGLRAHPSKENWLLVNDTYAVHLMPPLADLSEDAAHSVDAARHFALQARAQPGPLRMLCAPLCNHDGLRTKRFALQAGARAAAHALRALM